MDDSNRNSEEVEEGSKAREAENSSVSDRPKDYGRTSEGRGGTVTAGSARITVKRSGTVFDVFAEVEA